MADETRRSADKRKTRLEPLQALARREGWVVTTEEMRGAGISRDVVARQARDGVLVRQHQGVYLVGRTKPSPAERDLAAVKACGAGAVLSHRSAAARWGILRRHKGPVEVTARTQRRRRPGLIPHQADLDPQDVTTKDGTRLERKFLRFLREYAFPSAEHGVGLELEDGEKATLHVLLARTAAAV